MPAQLRLERLLQHYDCVDRPKQSPDLNTIKNAEYAATKVLTKFPENLLPNRPLFMHWTWYPIPQGELYNLVLSMNNLRRCVLNNV